MDPSLKTVQRSTLAGDGTRTDYALYATATAPSRVDSLGTVYLILSEPPFIQWDVAFTNVPLLILSSFLLEKYLFNCGFSVKVTCGFMLQRVKKIVRIIHVL